MTPINTCCGTLKVKKGKKNLAWQFTFLLLLTLSLSSTILFFLSSLYPWQWHLIFYFLFPRSVVPCITENVCFRILAKGCRHFSFIPLPINNNKGVWFDIFLFLFLFLSILGSFFFIFNLYYCSERFLNFHNFSSVILLIDLTKLKCKNLSGATFAIVSKWNIFA